MRPRIQDMLTIGDAGTREVTEADVVEAIVSSDTMFYVLKEIDKLHSNLVILWLQTNHVIGF